MVGEKTNKSEKDPEHVTSCTSCGQLIHTETDEKKEDVFDSRCFYCLAEKENCGCSD